MQVATAHSSQNAHPAVFASAMPFANLKGKALADLTSMATETTRVRGTLLFAADDAPESIFILCSGRVKLSITSQDGKTVILRIADAGDILGLSSALSNKAHEMSAEVIEPCRVKVIPVSEFVDFLQKHPEASMEATRCILNEYQATFDNLCRLAVPTTVAGRLAKLLLEWRHNRCEKGGRPDRLTVALTHEEIAGMTNTSRETVSRVLNQFQREKFIVMKGVSLTVLEPMALQQLAS